MKPRLKWKKDARATGLMRIMQGERGYTLVLGQALLGHLFCEGAVWVALIYRSHGPNVRLKGRWENTPAGLTAAKAALLTGVKLHGKLAEGEDT